MTLGEVGKITGQVKERVPAMTFTSPEKFIIQSAKRHVEKGGDKIKFVKKPGDLDAKGNRITDFDSEFIYKNKKYNYKQLLKEGKKIPAFKEVYKSFDDLNKLLSKKTIHPVTKEETTLKNVMEDAYGKGAGYGKGRSSYEIDHFKGVETEPFSDLRVLPRRINAAAGLIKEIEGQAKLGLLKTEDYTPEKAKSYIKKIGYDFTKDIDTLAKDELKLAEDILVRNRKLDTPIQIAKKAVLGKTEIPAAKKLSAFQELSSRVGSGVDPELLVKAGFEEFIKPGAKIAARGAAGAADLALSVGKGGTGLALGALLEADPIITGMSEGKTFGQAARDTFIGRGIDALPGVNLGSLNEDLLKLAKTDDERARVQARIDFQKERNQLLKEVQQFSGLDKLDDISLNEAGFTRTDLAKKAIEVGERFKDLETKAPNVFDLETENLIKRLAREEAEKRLENLKGIQGLIFGNRMAKDPDFIEDKTAQILAASTETPGATDSYTDQITPSFDISEPELDDIYEQGAVGAAKGGIMATRLGFASGTGPFPLKLMFMIKDRLNNLKQSTFSNYNDVRMFGEQKGIENILTPYKNVPDKNKLITALEDIEELKKLMPEEYQSILNDIANDTKQFNFKTANDRTKALVETLPSDIDFKKLSDDLFPMPNPEDPSMILLGPDNPFSRGRFRITTEVDTFTGKGKRTTRDYFDEETGEFLEEGKFVDEEPLDEEFSGMIRDMDKPDETN